MATLDIVIRDDEGKVVGRMIATEKVFRTGSVGFYANQKLELGGARYQVQFQAVKIGSKAEASATGNAPA